MEVYSDAGDSTGEIPKKDPLFWFYRSNKNESPDPAHYSAAWRTFVTVILTQLLNNYNKISTLYVKPEYRKRGIATVLVEKCFEWLGTTKPLITIADYRLDQFTGIIKKYGWDETQVLDAGYYNDHSREHVFNGAI